MYTIPSTLLTSHVVEGPGTAISLETVPHWLHQLCLVLRQLLNSICIEWSIYPFQKLATSLTRPEMGSESHFSHQLTHLWNMELYDLDDFVRHGARRSFDSQKHPLKDPVTLPLFERLLLWVEATLYFLWVELVYCSLAQHLDYFLPQGHVL